MIALGFRRLSMPAGGIGPVKRMLHSLNVHDVTTEMSNLLDRGISGLRQPLQDFATANGILVKLDFNVVTSS